MEKDISKLPGLPEYLKDDSHHQTLKLFVHCHNLKKTSKFSHRNPQIHCFEKDDKDWKFIGHTEVIKEMLDPKFTTTIKIKHVFEKQQLLRFQLFDVESSVKSTIAGQAEVQLSDIVQNTKNSQTFPIQDDGHEVGSIFIRAEPFTENRKFFFFQVKGINLHNKNGMFSTSSPYYKLIRSYEGQETVVYRSQKVHKNLNPLFSPFFISLEKLCNNDQSLPITIAFHSRDGKKERLMGQCTFCLDDIFKQAKTEFKLYKIGRNKDYGAFEFVKAQIADCPTFLDYVNGGTNIKLQIGIDFTDKKSKKTSMHWVSFDQENPYQIAMRAIYDVLIHYDTDKKVPVYGFGCSPPNTSEVSHCFPLNGNPEAPEIEGIDNILDAYRDLANKVKTTKTTYFEPVLQKAVEAAKQSSKNGSKDYIVLVILSDGIIGDMEKTIEQLKIAAFLPMSVVIVGIGDNDFKDMDKLDGDDGLWDKNHIMVERDLVQFVPFSRFSSSKDVLAMEMVEELPRQLLEYMTNFNIKPIKPMKNKQAEEEAKENKKEEE